VTHGGTHNASAAVVRVFNTECGSNVRFSNGIAHQNDYGVAVTGLENAVNVSQSLKISSAFATPLFTDEQCFELFRQQVGAEKVLDSYASLAATRRTVIFVRSIAEHGRSSAFVRF
jgi:hypothetical protein